jgi:hypothetical protein
MNSFDPAHFSSFTNLTADVVVNGVQAGTIKYPGEAVNFPISGELLQDGSNKIEVKMPQNRQLFAMVSSSIVSNADLATKNGDFTVTQSIQNISRPGQEFKVGDIGIVRLKVSASKDIANILVRDYLPAGLINISPYSEHFSGDFVSSYLLKPRTVAAYGDQKYTDFMNAEIVRLKANEAYDVVYPVMAVRKGQWTNAATQVSTPGAPEAQTIKLYQMLIIK